MTKSYYKIIDGNRYDREMLEVVEAATAEQSDGKISLDDARKLYDVIIDGNTFTDIEKNTLEYIREQFEFIPAADEWLSRKLEEWLLKRSDSKPAFKPAKKEPNLVGSSITPTKTTDKKRFHSTGGTSKMAENTEKPDSLSGAQKSNQTIARKSSSSSTYSGGNPGGKSSGIWKVLVVILVILIPVAFYVGRMMAPYKDSPATLAKISELESSLAVSNQELAALKSEFDELKGNLDEANLAAVRLEAEKNKVRKRIAAEIEEILKKHPDAARIEFDKDHLWLTFTQAKTYFDKGSAELNPPLKKILNRFFPVLVQALKNVDKDVAEIRFQGHSSSDWKYARNRSDAYLKNMTLSTTRAEAALEYCLGLKAVQKHKPWLTNRMVNAGFSDRKPILGKNKTEDQTRSRRITISIGTVIEK